MTTELVLLCTAALAAGLIYTIVGGAGLIQTPAALVLLPEYPVAVITGTLKIPAFTDTCFAIVQYASRVKLNYRQLALMMLIVFLAGFSASALLTMVSNQFMKPFPLFILIAVAVYTWLNKNFGDHIENDLSTRMLFLYIVPISLELGFYDGFIGPGAGSFQVFSFIHFPGFDFLRASANARFVNLATNTVLAIFFTTIGKINYPIAPPIAVCNGIGGLLGAGLAILKGKFFIRIFFLLVVSATIKQFAYDVFFR